MYDSIANESGNIRRQWRAVNSMLHPVVPPPTLPVEWASVFSDHFYRRIEKIRKEIARSPATDISPRPIGTPAVMDVLSPVTDVEVSRMIAQMPAKVGRADYFLILLQKSFLPPSYL